MDDSVINLRAVSFGYPDRHPVIDNLDLELLQGKKVGLIGPNGSGKTTLFQIIMGLLKPHSGTIEIFGKPTVEEKDFIRRKLQQGMSIDEVITLVEKEYEHRIS